MTPYEQAQDPATPPTTLDRLANAEDWAVRCAVARNLSTLPATLDRLAGDVDCDVRSAVAGNPATPPATLDRLAVDARWGVRSAVARNPATPPATLDRLAVDAHLLVRSAVARNPAILGNTQLAHCGQYALVLSRNGEYYAGCRGPMTLAEARAHWGPPRHDPRAVLFYAALDKHANL
jgi:hypothetical protein